MLKKEKMPRATEWAEQIKKEGFGLKIDTSYEEEKNDRDGIYGYRPCFYYNVDEIGYELDIILREQEAEDFQEWDDEFPEVKKFDLAVIFGIYEEDDANCAMVAGAVLAKMTDGIYFDVDEPMPINKLYRQCKEIDNMMKKR